MNKYIKIISAVTFNFLLLANANAAENKIKIGTEGAFMPWNGLTTDGKIIGYDIDVANEVCKKMKYTCEFVVTDWDGIIPALNSGKFDIIMAAVSITDERRKSVNFSKSYGTTGVTLASVDKSFNIQSIADAKKQTKGKVVGVQKGTISETFAYSELKGIASEIKSYATQDELNAELENKRVDIGVSDTSTWIEAEKNFPTIKTISKVFSYSDSVTLGEGVGAAFRKKDTKLLEKFNKALEEVRKEGKLKELAIKSFGFDASKE